MWKYVSPLALCMMQQLTVLFNVKRLFVTYNQDTHVATPDSNDDPLVHVCIINQGNGSCYCCRCDVVHP